MNEYKEKPNAPFLIRDLFLKEIALKPKSIITCYSARGSEIDPRALMQSLEDAGHLLALPVTKGKGTTLIFRRYKIGHQLRAGKMNILEPSEEAETVEPDILLVPLLAFDKRGYRLGYGGGYYDRTLSALRSHKKILAIGLAFSGQEAPEIPHNADDARLDKIVTELKVFEPL